MPDTSYESPSQPKVTPAVQWLIAANVGVYFLQAQFAFAHEPTTNQLFYGVMGAIAGLMVQPAEAFKRHLSERRPSWVV